MARQMHALTAAALLSLLLANVAAAGDPTLVGWWKCDEGTGTTAHDSSGYGNDGAFNGDPQWVEGYFGAALEFDGSGDYLDCGNDASLDLTTWTITFWLNLNQNKDYNGYIVKGVDAAENFEILTYGVGNFHFPILFEDGARAYANTETGVSVVGEWAHYAYSYDASEGRRFYKDGVLIFEDTESRIPQVTDEPLLIGNEGGTSRFVPGIMDDIRIYSRVLTTEELADVILGKGPNAELAASPSPEHEAVDVPRDVPLTWEAGQFAATHDVYLGTVFDDVNDASRTDPMGVLVSQGQTGTTYAPPAVFEFGRTYYWRVDEVNAAPDNTIYKGETWNFIVEPLAYPVAGVVATSNGLSEPGAEPENTVNGSGLNESDEHSTDSSDMWVAARASDGTLFIEYEFPRAVKLHQMLVWNYNVQFELMLGFGLKDVTVEYSANGTDWTTLGDVQFAQATAAPTYTANTTVDFGGVVARHVRLTVVNGYGGLGQYGLSEVRFLSIPVNAREPEPADGAVDVSVDTVLGWRAGREAVTHEVYLSRDEAALAEESALIDATDGTTVSPGPLDLATTYFWKVTEVNDAEAINVWEGLTWTFDTQDYVVVEDFESYDNDDNLIYESWIDGWSNGTGSTVGYLTEPFAEQTIVHGGGQSMPMFYDNAGVTTSKADFALSADWTSSGIQSLSLYFHGDPENASGQLFVKINNTRIDYHGDPADIARPAWQPWNVDLSTFSNVSNVSNVNSLTIGIEGAGASGVLYIDDIRLYPDIPEMITPVEPDSAGLIALYHFDGNADDSSGNGNDGTLNGGVAFAAGVAGDALDCDGVDGYVSTDKVASDLGIAGNAPRTVTVWVYTRAFANGGIYDVGARVAAQDFCLRTYNGTEDLWRIQYWGGDFDFSYDTDEKWVHFTHVHDGAGTKIYANGVLIVDWEKTLDTTDTNPWQIGRYGWPDAYFDGLIDELYLYNRALSAAEALGAAGQTTPRHKPFD